MHFSGLKLKRQASFCSWHKRVILITSITNLDQIIIRWKRTSAYNWPNPFNTRFWWRCYLLSFGRTYLVKTTGAVVEYGLWGRHLVLLVHGEHACCQCQCCNDHFPRMGRTEFTVRPKKTWCHRISGSTTFCNKYWKVNQSRNYNRTLIKRNHTWHDTVKPSVFQLIANQVWLIKMQRTNKFHTF